MPDSANTVGERMLSFLRGLKLDAKLPGGVGVMNPYKDPYTFGLCQRFYTKYYSDSKPRTLLLGINPGRFGSGTTGISFTDPIKLERICGIENTLPKRGELSADFIYKVVESFGGPAEFYSRYLVSAVSPLGFILDDRNINYYDTPKLHAAIRPFIVESISKLMSVGVSAEVCYCIGEGKNLVTLNKLNNEYKWFGEIIPLPHPRFIMQYRRKKLEEYLALYVDRLK